MRSAWRSWKAAVVTVVVLSSLVGCEEEHAALPLPDAAAKIEDAESSAKQIDNHAEEIMAGPNKAEAREWLKDSSHTFFKENRQQIAQFIEDYYAAGSSAVYIVDSEKHGEHVFGSALLVVLPKDSTGRSKVFEVDKKVVPVFDEDPISDEGPKYLIHGFD
jgi:hypothetical protein